VKIREKKIRKSLQKKKKKKKNAINKKPYKNKPRPKVALTVYFEISENIECFKISRR